MPRIRFIDHKICEGCKIEFEKPLKRSKKDWKTTRFCSWKCSAKHNVKKNKSAFQKGETPWNKGTKGMMKKNKTSFKKGLVPWNKGLISDKSKEDELQRKRLDYKEWRKACYERDDYTCQKTGERGGRLVVHHINNFSDYPELRTSLENGITLSDESHREFHSLFGRKNNTKEQLLEYLALY